MRQHIIYDIGTKILSLQKNGRNSTQIKPFSKILEDSGSSGPPPLDFSVNARFKAFWDIFSFKLYATLASQVTDFAREGDLAEGDLA